MTSVQCARPGLLHEAQLSVLNVCFGETQRCSSFYLGGDWLCTSELGGGGGMRVGNGLQAIVFGLREGTSRQGIGAQGRKGMGRGGCQESPGQAGVGTTEAGRHWAHRGQRPLTHDPQGL